MNKMDDTPREGKEPELVLVALERQSYYLIKGEEHLDEMLLVDGNFPKPVLCVHFENIFEAKRVIGDSFSPGSLWGVHPEIVERLRTNNELIETDA